MTTTMPNQTMIPRQLVHPVEKAPEARRQVKKKEHVKKVAVKRLKVNVIRRMDAGKIKKRPTVRVTECTSTFANLDGMYVIKFFFVAY